MHDNDVEEQTRELSYPKELKIILHFSESWRDAELHKANMCVLGLQLSNSLSADSFSLSSKAVFF